MFTVDGISKRHSFGVLLWYLFTFSFCFIQYWASLHEMNLNRDWWKKFMENCSVLGKGRKEWKWYLYKPSAIMSLICNQWWTYRCLLIDAKKPLQYIYSWYCTYIYSFTFVIKIVSWKRALWTFCILLFYMRSNSRVQYSCFWIAVLFSVVFKKNFRFDQLIKNILIILNKCIIRLIIVH